MGCCGGKKSGGRGRGISRRFFRRTQLSRKQVVTQLDDVFKKIKKLIILFGDGGSKVGGTSEVS